jgi:hypothetical protein
VRKLLVEFPEYVDTLLEKRSVLCQLDEASHVQWIAYGSIWPVGATDFLVVTTEGSFNASHPGVQNPHDVHESYLIASTSVDNVIEDEVETAGGENASMASADEVKRTEASKYNRSTLRLAGYSCVPNRARGGTDLRLFVDVDAARYVPAWLLQLLAQYGLSEMMTRIRVAAPSLTWNGVGHSPIFQPTSSKLDILLTQIQTREEKMRSMFVEDHSSTESKREERKRAESESQCSNESDNRPNPTDPTSMAYSSSSSLDVNSNPEMSVPTDGGVGKGMDLAAESQRIMKIYMGVQQDSAYNFDWQHKTKKSNVDVSVTPVVGSAWFALRATTTIADVTPRKLKDFLINDANIGLYDDMIENVEVNYLWNTQTQFESYISLVIIVLLPSPRYTICVYSRCSESVNQLPFEE